MACKAANVLPLCPFRSRNPIISWREVLDVDWTSAACHLPNFPVIQGDSMKVSLPDGPIFAGRIGRGSSACGEVEGLRLIRRFGPRVTGSAETCRRQKPNTRQSHARL